MIIVAHINNNKKKKLETYQLFFVLFSPYGFNSKLSRILCFLYDAFFFVGSGGVLCSYYFLLLNYYIV